MAFKTHSQTNPPKSSFFRRIWRSWRLDLTDSGRALLIGALATLFFGSYTASVDSYIFLGFFWIFATLGAFVTGYYRPKAILTHSLPKRAVCGETLPLSVKVKSERPTRDVIIHPEEMVSYPDNELAWMEISPKEQYLLTLASEQQEVRFKAHFKRRGNYIFQGFRVDSTFPMGIFRLGRGLYGKSLTVVYPWFSQLNNFYIPTGKRYQPGGVALASELGDSVEYIGNREYHEGDDLRNMDWRSWARLGIPVVREYQEEYFCRVALVIDTQRQNLAPKKADYDFEAAISLAAAIADYLSRQEYLVDIFAAGPQIYILESGRSLAHLDQILEVLACLEPSQQNPFSLIEPVIMERMATLTTVITIFLDIDQTRIDFLENLRDIGVGLKTIVCTSKEIENVELSQDERQFDFKVVHPDEIYQGIEEL